MKRFIVIFCLLLSGLCLSAQIPPVPDPPRLVNDYVGVLTRPQVDSLEHRLVAFNDSTSNVICVVIVDDLGNYEAADFAVEIGNKWGVRDENHRNGVVILIKTSSARGGDGDIYIATGYDLEGVLPDIVCNHIIQEQFIPELKNGNYYQAIVNGLDVILPAVAGEISVVRQQPGFGIGYVIALIVFFAAIALVLYFVSKNSSNGSGPGGKREDNGNLVDEAARAALVVEIIAETMAVEALAGEEVLVAALAALAVSAAVVALAAVALVENFNTNFY